MIAEGVLRGFERCAEDGRGFAKSVYIALIIFIFLDIWLGYVNGWRDIVY